MAGKRRKPPDQLAGQGSRYRGTSPLTLVPPDDRRAVPTMPPRLTARVAQAWRDYWADPVSQLARPLDWYDIRRYFTLLAERERLERKLDKEPTTTGSVGQEVVNPRHYLVKHLDREIDRYREDLGILPLNRMRLGIAHTTAHASFLDLMRESLERDPGPDVIDLEDLEGTEGEPD